MICHVNITLNYMNNNNLLFIFLLFILVGCTASNEYTEVRQITLDKGWLFHAGDDPMYAQNSLDDSKWNSIKPSSGWQQQGFNLAGFAWYRKQVIIPSS